MRIAMSAMAAAVAVGVFAGLSFTRSTVTTVSQARLRTHAGVLTLEGKVFAAGKNRYALVDRTGKAEMATCPTWYKQVSLRDGERAIVTGEVALGRPSVRGAAFVLTVFAIDGSKSGVTVVRDRPGKPPWALERIPNPVKVATLGGQTEAR